MPPPPEKISDPKISIIIPLHNAEKYIQTCIDSILQQTFQDFEVIVVDDCSTDRSLEIIQSYTDSRIRFVHRGENHGVGSARNMGLDLSCGKYIYFVDADDAIMPQTLETLFKAAEESQADVIHMNGYYYVGDDFKIPSVARVQKYSQWNSTPRFLEEDLVERLQKNFIEYGVHVTPWIKIQRRDFLLKNQIYFPIIYTFNDIYHNLAELCFTRKTQMIECCGYLYRISNNSLTRTNPHRRVRLVIQSIAPALKYMQKLFSRINLDREFEIKIEARMISDMVSNAMMSARYGGMSMTQIDDLLTELLFQSEQIDPNITRALIHTLAMKMKG